MDWLQVGQNSGWHSNKQYILLVELCTKEITWKAPPGKKKKKREDKDEQRWQTRNKIHWKQENKTPLFINIYLHFDGPHWTQGSPFLFWLKFVRKWKLDLSIAPERSESLDGCGSEDVLVVERSYGSSNEGSDPEDPL